MMLSTLRKDPNAAFRHALTSISDPAALDPVIAELDVLIAEVGEQVALQGSAPEHTQSAPAPIAFPTPQGG